MKLDAWLIAQKLTSAEFARLSGIGDRQAVHKYRHGERFPTPENLRVIREATGGEVTPDDFVDQHAGPSPPHRKRAKPAKVKVVAKPRGKGRSLPAPEPELEPA